MTGFRDAFLPPEFRPPHEIHNFRTTFNGVFPMDISTLSLNELRKLQVKVENEIRRRSDSTRKELLKRIEKMAAEQGLSMSELIGTGNEAPAQAQPQPQRRTRRVQIETPVVKEKLPPEYFHPEDPSIGWSGKGRRPQWVLNWLEAGKSLEDLKKKA